MEEWDPIGVRGVPEAADEYDAYVGKVYVMLMGEESMEAIASYLLEIATGRMGFPRDSELVARSTRTAEKLINLRPSFRMN